MQRKQVLRGVLVLVGLIFTALAYPMVIFVRQEPALAMMLSVYATLGIFLLMAARDPAANRSLVAFTAWSSLAHAAFMSMQAMRNIVARGELIGSAVLFAIGVALIVLSPAKEPAGSCNRHSHEHRKTPRYRDRSVLCQCSRRQHRAACAQSQGLCSRYARPRPISGGSLSSGLRRTFVLQRQGSTGCRAG